MTLPLWKSAPAPRLFRRGEHPEWAGYGCRGCGRSDVPAVVEFSCGPDHAAYDSYSERLLVCSACLAAVSTFFSDPSLVETKTPLYLWEKPARDFATKMHGDQKYDSGTAPYVVHLAAVRDCVIEFGFGPGSDLYGENCVTAAWLHDVLEDTTTSNEMVGNLFGLPTLKFVWAVTGVGKNRKQRNEDAYQKMEKEPFAIPLKLADRISNMYASKISSPDKLFPMYVTEYPTFRGRLRDVSLEHVPKCRAMWNALDVIYVSTGGKL